MEKNTASIDNQGGSSTQGIEEMFRQLDQVLEELGKEGVSLEESFDLYQKGMLLLKRCSAAVDEVEKKVLILDESGEKYEFQWGIQ